MGTGQAGRSIVAIKTKTGMLVSFTSKGMEIFGRFSRPSMARCKLLLQESRKEKGLGKGTHIVCTLGHAGPRLLTGPRPVHRVFLTVSTVLFTVATDNRFITGGAPE